MADASENNERLVACCERLQTKMKLCALEDMRAGPGFVRVSDTATYWCDKTAETFGPDNRPSTPETCQPGRECYRRDL